MAEFLRYNEFIVDLRGSVFLRSKGDSLMQQRLRGKVAALGAAVVLCAGGSLLGSAPPETSQPAAAIPAGVSAVQTQGVQVYVSGAVAKPGLYQVPAGSRATAAIAAAGGMTPEANRDKVNLAKLLKDGMQVNVPRLSGKALREQGVAGSSNGAGVVATGSGSVVSSVAATYANRLSAAKTMGKVHLNTASAAELTALPGVGTVTAQRIVEYRDTHSFGSVDEIMQVKGIGKAKFAKMQPYLEL